MYNTFHKQNINNTLFVLSSSAEMSVRVMGDHLFSNAAIPVCSSDPRLETRERMDWSLISDLMLEMGETTML